MLRKDALAAAVAMVARVAPVLTESSHHSTHRRLGVAIDSIPALRIECIAGGRTRTTERIALVANVAGLSSEPEPLFLDPPYQGQPLFNDSILVRNGERFAWTRAEDDIVATVKRAMTTLWTRWVVRARSEFAADPAAWVAACEWVSVCENPARWRASGWDVRGRALLREVTLPSDDEAVGGWTLAWLGFADVLDRIVAIDSSALARIRDAARVTRARIAGRHAELDAETRDEVKH